MDKIKLYQVPQIDSLQELLLNSAIKYSNKLAMEDLSNTPISKVTYSELLNYVLKFGSALKKLGLEERSHIAIIGENRVQWAISYFTCMVFNYVAVPIDRNLTQNEIFNIIHESNSDAIIFSSNYSDIFDESHLSLKKIEHFICMDEGKLEAQFLNMKELIDDAPEIKINDLPKIDKDELAEIIFTSGSLGRAKGVMLSQGNIASNIVAMTSMLFIYPEDRFLSVLPMHHSYECTCGMLCPIYCGASVHYARSLRTVVDDLQKVNATMLLAVPLLFDKMYKKITKSISEEKLKSILVPKLVGLSNFAEKIGIKNIKKKLFSELHQKFGGNIRIFIAGGAAPDPQVASGLRGLGFNFLQGYGLTESSPILALNQLDNFKDYAAGLPMPNAKIIINSPDENGVGEIFAKGTSVMLGYYKNDEATNDTFQDGWFKTGDLGYFDADGFLIIAGRKKNVIISKSGKNVFPEEIEDMLNRNQFILESIVYGKADNKQDEIIAAKIVPDAEAFIELSEREHLTINESLMREVLNKEIEKVNKQLPSYKRVVNFEIRETEFEKTTTQKIKRYSSNNQ
ncbi:MAG: AMP-binding protein [Bacteroidetes bacterium]|nr:AMP-binding protein [Bacteroidota bacterium]MBU1115362.1 AMP-binding protein [Bacteroidota bacterium]MBU1797768.1 AMP-binding protein [Bacteroidota bacterium]